MSHASCSSKKISKNSSFSQKHKRQTKSNTVLDGKIGTKLKSARSMDYKVTTAKKKLPSVTEVHNKDDNRAKHFREKRHEIMEKYSLPKTKEIFVNRNKLCKEQRRSECSSEKVVKNVVSSPKSSLPCYVKVNASRKPCSKLNVKINKLKIEGKPDTSKSFSDKSVQEPDLAPDKILAEAHRMIWTWLFHGLGPRNLRQKTVIKH